MIDFSVYGYTKRAVYVNNVLSLNQGDFDIKTIETMTLKKGDRGSGIYGIFNLVTKNLYVGSTKDFHKRLIHHSNDISKRKSWALINADIDKTGAKSFVFIKIHEVPLGQLIEAENFWMKSLRATYNIRKAVELKIPIESKRTGRKAGIALMNHYSSAVTKFSLSGEYIKEYTSIRAAAVEHGGKHLAYKITKCCRGKLGNAFDSIWKYTNGMTPAKPKHIKTLELVPIIQIDINTGEFIKLWGSCRDAAIFYGLKSGSIRSVCENKKNAAGFYWRYANLKTFKV